MGRPEQIVVYNQPETKQTEYDQFYNRSLDKIPGKPIIETINILDELHMEDELNRLKVESSPRHDAGVIITRFSEEAKDGDMSPISGLGVRLQSSAKKMQPIQPKGKTYVDQNDLTINFSVDESIKLHRI